MTCMISIHKEERSQIIHNGFHFKRLEKQEQIKPDISNRGNNKD